MVPTVNALQRAWPRLTLVEAKAVRAILRDPSLRPSESLARVSPLIGGYGAEYIPAGEGTKSPGMHYVNMGDPYEVTIIRSRSRVTGRSNSRIGCWGHTVERGNYA